MATLQEQMAGPSRLRFNGWLTMAPDVDPLPIAPILPLVVETVDAAPAPLASTHGFGMLGQAARLPQRKKKRPTFQVGSPGHSDSDGAGTGSRSSHSSSDAPEFDVRASFAPMPTYGKAQSSSLPLKSIESDPEPEDAGGLSFAGRQWRGKTVHAVEQELEALQDIKLMSHAPDAAYLASRLEGLRRNLEIEERQPTYVAYDEDTLSDFDEPRILAHPDPGLDPLADTHSAAEVALRMGVRALPTLAHRPISNASSISLLESETPEDFQYSLGPSALTQAIIHDPDQLSSSSSPRFVSASKTIDPAARAAALNARIEVRNLRRNDVDQVRDLHAFHGEFEQGPRQAETYASTAPFLLRLLVDDRHVCLVAVAKPIPEPSAPLPVAAHLPTFAATEDSGSGDSCAASPASSAASPESVASEDEVPVEVPSLRLPTAGAYVQGSTALARESTPSSLFPAARKGPSLLPRRKRFLSPRGQDGRINNTPATSVFSDLLAERGVPAKRFTLDDLPGPTEETEQAHVKRVLGVPPARPVILPGEHIEHQGQSAVSGEAETIVGVVSAKVSVVIAPSEDSLWTINKEDTEPSALIDIHLLTLAIAPEERGQGLGAKLLSALHGECMIKARLMAMRLARPTGRGRTWGAIPTVQPLTPQFIDLPDELFNSGDAASSTQQSDLLSSIETLPGKSASVEDEVKALLSAADAPAPVGKHLTRMFLELHPSNLHALALYTAHGFIRPSEATRAVKKGFYRGDTRIATRERAKPGGTDAWVLERFDGPLEKPASPLAK